MPNTGGYRGGGVVNAKEDIVAMWCKAAMAEVCGERGNGERVALGLGEVFPVVEGKCMVDG